MTDDQRVRHSTDGTRQIEREDAERRAAEEVARLEARQELLSNTPGAASNSWTFNKPRAGRQVGARVERGRSYGILRAG